MKLISCLNIFVFFLSFQFQCIAQVSEMRYALHPPLKIPLSYSGSFGELRKTHFHSGVDFKTNGKCGYRVYASEKGFVARIVVSPTGYGRAVYIQHPNGLMTVYAHLRNFSPQIEKYVREQQYGNECWALDTGVKEGVLPVKKGMIIGYSGNSGSSGGPHLHYEVRDAVSQEPMNPFFYFNPKDNIRPKIQELYVYDLGRGNDIFSCPVDKIPVDYINRKFVLKDVNQISCSGEIGFGLRVKDFINGSWNSCGIYSIEMFVNDELRYKYEVDRFSFANTSSVNIIKDYKIDSERGVKVYKTWFPGSCRFEGVKCCIDKGLLKVERDSLYNMRFEISDMSGNKSLLDFRIKGEEAVVDDIKKNGIEYIAGKSHCIKLGDMDVCVGDDALFDDVYLNSYMDTIRGAGYYNDMVYCLNGEYVPLKKALNVTLKLDSAIVSKAYFVNMINGGEPEAVSSWVEGDTLCCRLKNMGSLSVVTDTVAPVIKPLGNYTLKHFGKNGRMSFCVEESGSGLLKYEGRLDGIWVLTSYDAKRGIVECVFDRERLKTGSRHNFVLTVSDNCGNVSEYTTRIYF